MKEFDQWVKELGEQDSFEKFQQEPSPLPEGVYETEEGYMVPCNACENYFEWPASYEDLVNCNPRESFYCGKSPRCLP